MLCFELLFLRIILRALVCFLSSVASHFTCLVRELQQEQAHGMLFQAAFRHLGTAEEVCEVTLVQPHPSVGL